MVIVGFSRFLFVFVIVVCNVLHCVWQQKGSSVVHNFKKNKCIFKIFGTNCAVSAHH